MSNELNVTDPGSLVGDTVIMLMPTDTPWPFVRGRFRCRVVDESTGAFLVVDSADPRRQMVLLRSALLGIELAQ